MIKLSVLAAACAAFVPLVCLAQAPKSLAPYVKEEAHVLVLNHVRLIDGTGAAAREDMRVDIADGKIAGVQSAKLRNAFPPDAKVLDLTGKTVLPGLVGMHEHMFYPAPGGGDDLLPLYSEAADTAPRLYLAGGITTARTGGSLEPYTDLAVKAKIDAGKIPGPKLQITGPYLEGSPSIGPQLHELKDADDAGRLVDYWAAEGATSFKAYMHIQPEELKAAIEHAHAKGLKVTGHLCSVGFREAAELGIDNLEHGLVVDTEFYTGKKHGECPGQRPPMVEMQKLDIESAPVQQTIRDLVAHHVAVTSTLAIFESFAPNRPPLSVERRAERALAPQGWSAFLATRASIAEHGDTSVWAPLLKKEMQFEHDFVKAGGLLMFGCDPTGYGGVLPGFGDQRALELLVEAGFSPVEAIHIASENGAKWLGQEASIGTVAQGKAADLVVIDGNPAITISDIEKVETVFKDGVGYDPAKLIESVRGLVGLR